MTIGVSGGNDQGVPIEVQLSDATEIGNDVLRTAKARSSFTVHGDRPNILFLEPEKFSEQYITGLTPNGKIDSTSVEVAKKSSLGLAIETSLQIVDAKPYKSVFVEDTDSLADISRMLSRSGKFVEAEVLRDSKLLASVAREIAEKRKVEISGDKDLVGWANENLVNAKKRIDKKIAAIEEADRGY
jgi:hypothetical protein